MGIDTLRALLSLYEDSEPPAIRRRRTLSAPSVLETGVLTVGADASPPPPMQLGDPAGETFEGFEVDLLQAIGGRLGLTVRYRSALWSTILGELEAGMLDVVCTAATVTAERARDFRLGRPYLEIELVAVVPADSLCAVVNDLRGSPIAVRAGTVAETFVREQLDPSQVLLTEFNDEAYAALRNGAASGLVDDSPIATWFVEQEPGLRIAGSVPGTRSSYAMVFRRSNDELASAIDASLEELVADGTLEVLRNRWFSGRATVKPSPDSGRNRPS